MPTLNKGRLEGYLNDNLEDLNDIQGMDDQTKSNILYDRAKRHFNPSAKQKEIEYLTNDFLRSRNLPPVSKRF